MGRIYLDHVASSPLLPRAREAMVRATLQSGNPASPHAEGRAAKDLLEEARTRIARTWGARPREIVFTASGTVACQLALLGAAKARRETSRRVVVSGIEHAAVSDATPLLETMGFEVVVVPPDAEGRIPAGSFLEAVGDDAAVAALMLANHETGALQPVAEVAGELEGRGIPLVCDACLGPGRRDVGQDQLGADLVALSAHKFGGPMGLGLLFVRRGTRIDPVWRGGLQEERLHAGTENTVAAVGAAAALEQAVSETAERASIMASSLAAFLAGLEGVQGWRRVGPSVEVLPGVATIELHDVEGEAAMINLDLQGIAVSTGSTCALGGAEPSAGLLAMGLTRRRASSTLRVSTGPATTLEEATHAANSLIQILERLRRLAGR